MGRKEEEYGEPNKKGSEDKMGPLKNKSIGERESGPGCCMGEIIKGWGDKGEDTHKPHGRGRTKNSK